MHNPVQPSVPHAALWRARTAATWHWHTQWRRVQWWRCVQSVRCGHWWQQSHLLHPIHTDSVEAIGGTVREGDAACYTDGGWQVEGALEELKRYL